MAVKSKSRKQVEMAALMLWHLTLIRFGAEKSSYRRSAIRM